MSPYLDLLALTLLALFALIAIFLHLRFYREDGAAVPGDESFSEQQHFDPAQMRLPLTGLDGNLFDGDGYVPAPINRLLWRKVDEAPEDADAAGLDAVLQPSPAARPDKPALRLTWTVTTFVVLLGLVFLLLQMLSFR